MKKLLLIAVFALVACNQAPETYSIDPKQVTFIQKPEGQEVDPSIAQGSCEIAVGVFELKTITFKGKEVSFDSKITVTNYSNNKIGFSLGDNKNDKGEFVIISKTPEKLLLALPLGEGVVCSYTFNKTK